MGASGRAIGATLDASLTVSVDRLTPLYYAGGALPLDDLPAHVRSASAVRRAGDELVIVQDDVNALAIRDRRGQIRPLLLPRGADGRRMFDDTLGNKHEKLDLEACAALPDGRLVAFGSGASSARETLVVIADSAPPRLLDGGELYRALRAEPEFAGQELNLEGAVARGRELLLFQRATGASRRAADVGNAIGALDLDDFLRWLDTGAAAPRLASITRVDLGEIAGMRLGFTDAALAADGRIAILACAEDTPDALSDGPVVGCRFGWLDGSEIRTADVVDAAGRPTPLKLEGIEPCAGPEDEFDVVADVDRPGEPALLARLRIADSRRR